MFIMFNESTIKSLKVLDSLSTGVSPKYWKKVLTGMNNTSIFLIVFTKLSSTIDQLVSVSKLTGSFSCVLSMWKAKPDSRLHVERIVHSG